jgi:hypothetical protein
MFLRLSTLAALAILATPTQALPPPPAPPTVQVAGEYTGVVDNGTFETSGYFRLVLSKGGRGSVSVRLGDEPVCVVGIGYNPGSSSGNYFFTLPGGDPDMLVRIIVTIEPGGNPVVTGEVEDDGHIYPVVAPKVGHTAGPAAGRHTLMIGSTPGIGDTGSGFVRITPGGRVIGVANVKGSRPVSFGGLLPPSLELPVAARIGRSDASLVGKVGFNTPNASGALTLHDEASNQALLVGGMPYNPRLPALTGATPSFPLEVLLNGTVSGSAVRLRNGTIGGGKLNGQPLRLSVVRATGLVSGRSGTQIFRGVVLQGANSLGGLVNGTTPFEVRPDTTP